MCNCVSKLEATHGSTCAAPKLVLLRCLVHGWCQIFVLLLSAEITFNDVKGFLVDLSILMTLQKLNFIQT